MRARGHRFFFTETPWTFRKLILILVLGTFVLCLQHVPAAAGGSFDNSPPVKVMTQNLYFGVDIHSVLGVDPNQIPVVVAGLYQMLMQTDFPARAEALAEEIARQEPDLGGLQEVATFRTQSPSDFFINPTPNAEDPLFDYLQILLTALTARGLYYEAVAVVEDTDVELPMCANDTCTALADMRLTDHDVVLVRDGVGYSNAFSSNYTNNLELNVGGLPLIFKRGYVGVDATVSGKTYRFVNTHLEEREAGPIQAAQAYELIQVLAHAPLPVILVGDLNCSPKDKVVRHPEYGLIVPPYKQLIRAGYADAWKRRLLGRSNPGFTCCQAPLLDNTESLLYERVDHILVLNKPDALPVVASLVGDELEPITTSVFWPSDHAGVVARMLIPSFKGR
jgi:endonuclease/exonuclease/phosphatase family metal-dependent hydrolase